ncbi:hypothetical protein [Hydrogenophaga sp. PBC]|uniref:hypothetical protein n=1 Tax=Hydrogenophaga sp. PBC TaxID=795665 RepID=UPI000260887B|nr:hypothetical protein [Hydrogenophaga sp. PBC]
MTTFERLTTISIAVIGAVSGSWGAYTAHEAAKFKQPFDEHHQMAESFHGQISSAEKRKDLKEVNRIRVLYEKFEEGWREARKISTIVAPVEALERTTLKYEETEKLKLLMARQENSDLNLPPKTLGAAYLAIGDFTHAAQQLKVAASGTDDARVLALQSVAYEGLAKNAKTDDQRNAHEMSAVASFRNALNSSSAQHVELAAFAKANPDLNALLTVNGVTLESSTNTHKSINR